MFAVDIALRSIIIYLFIVLAIRFFGKKELAQLSVIDLVFILLISNAVQNAMIGQDSSLLGGIIAAISLFIVNQILKFIFFKSERLSELFQGSPLMLIYHGKVMKQHLKSAQITEEELEASVREHGVADIRQVDLAVLEIDGNISILSNDFKHKTIRKRRDQKGITK